MKVLFTAKTIPIKEEQSISVVGYYVFSNQDQKHLIIAKDNTPMEENSEITWQKVYEIDFDTLEVLK